MLWKRQVRMPCLLIYGVCASMYEHTCMCHIHTHVHRDSIVRHVYTYTHVWYSTARWTVCTAYILTVCTNILYMYTCMYIRTCEHSVQVCTYMACSNHTSILHILQSIVIFPFAFWSHTYRGMYICMCHTCTYIHRAYVYYEEWLHKYQQRTGIYWDMLFRCTYVRTISYSHLHRYRTRYTALWWRWPIWHWCQGLSVLCSGDKDLKSWNCSSSHPTIWTWKGERERDSFERGHSSFNNSTMCHEYHNS